MSKVSKKGNLKDLEKFISGFLFEEPELDENGLIKTPRYETGIVPLDTLLNGGFPQGKAIAIGAEPGVGKTTLLIQACGNIVEKYDKKVYYLDIEGGATYELINSMGYGNLLFNPKENPDGKFFRLAVSTIQEVATIIKRVAEDPDTAVVVIDSDTAVTDQLMVEDEFLGTNNNAAGYNARMWSKVSGPLNAIIRRTNICLVIVHQARVNLSGFMAKIEAAGGNALKHLVSAEIWGRRKGWIGEDNTLIKQRSESVGAYVEFTTEKNRLTVPFAKVNIPIFFGRGASNKWSYKEWLEENLVADATTGEMVPFLSMRGGGYYTLRLPSGTYQARGQAGVWELIDEHIEEIIQVVEANDGFKVSRAEEPEEYSDNTIFDR